MGSGSGAWESWSGLGSGLGSWWSSEKRDMCARTHTQNSQDTWCLEATAGLYIIGEIL